MTSPRLRLVEEIFHAALDREPAQIDAFLATACEGDALLRCRVETLLALQKRVGDFLETSAVGLATKVLQNTSTDLLVGQRIGHYELIERIGAGGMGEVYLATDVTAGRKAALKLLPMRFTADTERLRRFAQEARAVVGLNHPNIVTVYEIGEDHSTHYIASELIDGETLRQRLERGPMEIEEAVDVAIQTTSALVAAHDAGIVHRDIKPENIMLRPDGYVKVLDFGIAKLAEQEMPATMAEEEAVPLVETHLGSIFGTARYMSPEQARGASVDKRTDIWSLGVVLYEMLAGRIPFEGESAREVMTSILETDLRPLTDSVGQIPDELERIVRRTLHKQRDERYKGARELFDALKGVRRRMDLSAESKNSTAASSRHWMRSPAAVVLAVLVAALALALPYYWHRDQTANSMPEKSIAVLPFENLSEGQENASFAAGIQDDLLTSLAQIHDLKVTSRTSVMSYQKPSRSNVREIGRALGVANLLEGSVRRAGNRVLVNVQLIDARNDRHLWAESYDRTVADSIGLQSELATQIAATLKATLAPEEIGRLGADPTTSSEAYVLYLTALGKEDKNGGENDNAAEQLYVRATTIDPRFALAYARASILNSYYLIGDSDSQERKSKARAQAEEALRLSPDLGEAHMARGLCFYTADKNYNAALKEFEIAAARSPNNAEVYSHIGIIYRRQGRWRESLASFDRAQSLDPRNVEAAFVAALGHLFVRDWAMAGAGFHRTLELDPNHANSMLLLAHQVLFQQGDAISAEKILRDMPTGPAGGAVWARWDLAMRQRDYTKAEKVLGEFAGEYFFNTKGNPKTFFLGQTALARGDRSTAESFFSHALPAFEELIREAPDDPNRHAGLGLLYAYMNRKEDAIREGRRAVELEPESQNAFHGAVWAAHLALVYALTHEQDQAITLIERLLSTPGPVGMSDDSSNITLADLRLRWEWDSLRSNPRFQKVLSRPEPKTIY